MKPTPKQLPDPTKVDAKPQWKVGTRVCDAGHQFWRYVGIDFGMLYYKDDAGKRRCYHHKTYRWLPDVIETRMVFSSKEA